MRGSYLHLISNTALHATFLSYNLLTKRMQAKFTREEKTTGIDMETSELDALPEEVLEKEKELIILNEI